MSATSPTIDLKLRASALAPALQGMGLRVAIVGEEAVGMPVSYFDELETRNDIVLLVASIGDTPWFRLTQRHSDRLWLFARVGCAALVSAVAGGFLARPPVPTG